MLLHSLVTGQVANGTLAFAGMAVLAFIGTLDLPRYARLLAQRRSEPLADRMLKSDVASLVALLAWFFYQMQGVFSRSSRVLSVYHLLDSRYWTRCLLAASVVLQLLLASSEDWIFRTLSDDLVKWVSVGIMSTDAFLFFFDDPSGSELTRVLFVVGSIVHAICYSPVIYHHLILVFECGVLCTLLRWLLVHLCRPKINKQD